MRWFSSAGFVCSDRNRSIRIPSRCNAPVDEEAAGVDWDRACCQWWALKLCLLLQQTVANVERALVHLRFCGIARRRKLDIGVKVVLHGLVHPYGWALFLHKGQQISHQIREALHHSPAHNEQGIGTIPENLLDLFNGRSFAKNGNTVCKTIGLEDVNLTRSMALEKEM